MPRWLGFVLRNIRSTCCARLPSQTCLAYLLFKRVMAAYSMFHEIFSVNSSMVLLGFSHLTCAPTYLASLHTSSVPYIHPHLRYLRFMVACGVCSYWQNSASSAGRHQDGRMARYGSVLKNSERWQRKTSASAAVRRPASGKRDGDKKWHGANKRHRVLHYHGAAAVRFLRWWWDVWCLRIGAGCRAAAAALSRAAAMQLFLFFFLRKSVCGTASSRRACCTQPQLCSACAYI